MLKPLTIRELFDAGVHYGHRSSLWHPKNKEYIYGVRNRIHIIDLDKTLPLVETARKALYDTVLNFGNILFVGTKRVAQKAVAEGAKSCGMPYVSERWLGGTLTNFHTVKKSISRLKKYNEQLNNKELLEKLSKKEVLELSRSRDKLSKGLSGICDIEKIPDMVFVIDVAHENIAVNEAIKLSIPVIGVVDTNNYPDNTKYVIPGNDDSHTAVELYVAIVVDAIEQAKADRSQDATNEEASPKTDPKTVSGTA